MFWKKKDSTFEPDFCAQKLNSNPWIVQPFEHYEEIRINDLIKKHQKLKGQRKPALKFLSHVKTKYTSCCNYPNCWEVLPNLPVKILD